VIGQGRRSGVCLPSRGFRRICRVRCSRDGRPRETCRRSQKRPSAGGGRPRPVAFGRAVSGADRCRSRRLGAGHSRSSGPSTTGAEVTALARCESGAGEALGADAGSTTRPTVSSGAGYYDVVFDAAGKPDPQGRG
jgi:hypothetical protein